MTKQLFLLSSVKTSGRFFQIFVPFQKSWTLTLSTNIVLNLQCKDLILSNLRYCICLYWLVFPSWYFGSKTVQIKLCSRNIGTKRTSNGVHFHQGIRLSKKLGSGIQAWKKDLTISPISCIVWLNIPPVNTISLFLSFERFILFNSVFNIPPLLVCNVLH